jgi:hypothetical protein
MAAADQIVFTTRRDRIAEKSAITITARFLGAGTAVTPTNVSYRLDNLETGREVLDWTSVTTGLTATITLPGSLHDCLTRLPVEQFQLQVAADYGLSTEYRESYCYQVRNLFALN